jgi:penicillin amidase
MHMKVTGDDPIEVNGGSMPGMPMILIGSNGHCSWGMTTNFMDTSDIYSERIEGDKYLLDDEWKKVKVVTEEIKVKGKEAVQFGVRMTHRGPVISDVLGNVQMVFGTSIPTNLESKDYSLAWTGLIPKESFVKEVKKMNKFQSGQWLIDQLSTDKYYSAQ